MPQSFIVWRAMLKKWKNILDLRKWYMFQKDEGIYLQLKGSSDLVLFIESGIYIGPYVENYRTWQGIPSSSKDKFFNYQERPRGKEGEAIATKSSFWLERDMV